ncbi:MAG: alpha/beta hydrolase [Verrucomicrobiales bacterium]|jgi:acetyl esterase/lipase|nr:alpha/beta hydrolase [Verrucomicrobiales bacterium]
MKSTTAIAFATCCLLLATPLAIAQEGEIIPLWPDGAPGFEDRKDEPEVEEKGSVTNVHFPTLTAFRPPEDKANGVAILIAPGGGLRKLGMQGGGYDPARFLASHGYTTFVLKYRLSRQPGVPYKFEEHVLEDGQRAIRMVRHRAKEFGIDPSKVGMLGFSAGGEVVSITCYKPGSGDPEAADPVDRLNAKPDFQMLVYPGPVGIPSKLPEDTPPAFMLIAADDNHTSVLLNLMQRFREIGVDYEAHIYARGGHGFGMGTRSKRLSIQKWPERMLDWLHDEVVNDIPK